MVLHIQQGSFQNFGQGELMGFGARSIPCESFLEAGEQGRELCRIQPGGTVRRQRFLPCVYNGLVDFKFHRTVR